MVKGLSFLEVLALSLLYLDQGHSLLLVTIVVLCIVVQVGETQATAPFTNMRLSITL